ncbi:uncharacterized protein PG986_004489 [Apiospora aurea]|uniref:Uncharacterized protein n=1 Tax=Apiospora aurea TaxID=335848 RepID=A0ABR1QNH2_9PEZI
MRGCNRHVVARLFTVGFSQTRLDQYLPNSKGSQEVENGAQFITATLSEPYPPPANILEPLLVLLGHVSWQVPFMNQSDGLVQDDDKRTRYTAPAVKPGEALGVTVNGQPPWGISTTRAALMLVPRCLVTDDAVEPAYRRFGPIALQRHGKISLHFVIVRTFGSKAKRSRPLKYYS